MSHETSNQQDMLVATVIGENPYTRYSYPAQNDEVERGRAGRYAIMIAKECLRRSVPETTRDAEDAARYRFLREPDNAIVYAKHPDVWGVGGSGHVRYRSPEELDTAIDVARGAEKTSGDSHE